jgi:protein gp37
LPYIPLMEASPHIYLILTKKPRRMWQFFREYGHVPYNFWLGTTVTSRETSSRIGDLLSLRYVTPRVILWASIEPLLGAMNLQKIYFRGRYINALGGWEYSFKSKWWVPAPKLDWVAAGAESESILGEARPWNPQWAYELRDQCTQTRTKFFWKQNGEWAPWINWLTEETDGVGRPRITPPKYTKWGCIDYNGKFLAETTTWNGREGNPYDNFEYTMIKVGRKASGRLLEGQEWNQMPYYPIRNIMG